MRALVFQSSKEKLKIIETGNPVLEKGEVLVKLKYASLNHLDIWIWKEQVQENPIILGSDGSGTILSVGEGVNTSLIGLEVIINPSLNWGSNEKVPAESFQILGNSINGTFAEFISVPQENVHEKPKHLSLKEAATLPMAGLTAYRALFTKARIQQSDKVLITGIGGGAALFILQMAVAVGCSVYVTSSSDEKIQTAISLGAKGGFNYKVKEWEKTAKKEAGGFDVIVDSAGGDGFTSLTEVANPAGRIVLFGRTAGNINNLRPGIIFNKQLKIMGTLMGTQSEFKSMLDFYEKHNLKPIVDKEFSLDTIEAAFMYMNDGGHFGKISIEI